ncbi:hypothetical protein L2E82_46277 [Cichorium intybus]|uniref:Uncharacterized protein n=1 Tax=Cichorium intybus TaxID=13427 RepID=A0ACB8YSY8_CICIN|nr:hypothetical protein L2E82_46277 [Cichorium intybus]
MLSKGEPLGRTVHIMTAGAPPVSGSKYVIISGGENLGSVEVESVLYLHTAVNEATVVGRPEFWGETPCAFVSLKDDGGKPLPTAEEIMEFCKGKLTGYMIQREKMDLRIELGLVDGGWSSTERENAGEFHRTRKHETQPSPSLAWTHSLGLCRRRKEAVPENAIAR